MTGRRQKKAPLWVWVVSVTTLLAATVAIGAMAYSRRTQDIANRLAVSTSGAQAAATASSGGSGDPSGTSADSYKNSRTSQEIFYSTQGGVVTLTAYNASGDRINSGAAFLIDANKLVTTFHLLRGATSAEVEFKNQQTLKLKGIRAWDIQADLAIVELEATPAVPTVLALSSSTERRLSTKVVSVGPSQLSNLEFTEGIISTVCSAKELPIALRQTIDAKNDQVWLQTTAPAPNGISGSPVLDTFGNVIGVNSHVWNDFGLAIDARYVVDLVRAMSAEHKPLAHVTGPDERLKRIMGEYDRQLKELGEQMSRAASEIERQEIRRKLHPASDTVDKLFAFSVEYDQAPASFDALQEIFQIAGDATAPSECGETLQKAANRLVERYKSDPRLVHLLWSLRGSPQRGALVLLRRMADEGGSREIRGVATYAAALAMQTVAVPSEFETMMDLLERVKDEFSEIVYYSNDPSHPEHRLGSEAEELLYEIKYLAIGRPAMDIVENNADGTSLKLSSYRGRVVLLAFWADWAAASQQMWPQERAMVKELQNEPFVMLGVFAASKAKLQQLIDSQTITWANWVDGQEAKIGRQWRVNSYPTYYVIDHEGIIRFKATGRLPEGQLNSLIRELIAKIPANSARATASSRP